MTSEQATDCHARNERKGKERKGEDGGGGALGKITVRPWKARETKRTEQMIRAKINGIQTIGGGNEKVSEGPLGCRGRRGLVEYQQTDGWRRMYECFILPLDEAYITE